MRHADTAFSHACTRRGFNLVEAAIVLGVVGLVIGGIWVAASAVQDNLFVNSVTSKSFLTCANAQKFPSRDWTTSGEIMDFAMKARIFPEDWATSPAYLGTSSRLFVPEGRGFWINGITVSDGSMPPYTAPTGTISFSPRGMSIARCIKLITRLATAVTSGSAGGSIYRISYLYPYPSLMQFKAGEKPIQSALDSINAYCTLNPNNDPSRAFDVVCNN